MLGEMCFAKMQSLPKDKRGGQGKDGDKNEGDQSRGGGGRRGRGLQRRNRGDDQQDESRGGRRGRDEDSDDEGPRGGRGEREGGPGGKDDEKKFGSFQEFLGMDENGVFNEDKFYMAMNEMDAGNDIDVDAFDFMRWLKKNEESVCKPYRKSINRILEDREELES